MDKLKATRIDFSSALKLGALASKFNNEDAVYAEEIAIQVAGRALTEAHQILKAPTVEETREFLLD